MIADEFRRRTAALLEPGMGTENVALLLSTLVLMNRPRVLVEVGTGYTTPYLLAALDEAAGEASTDRHLLSQQEGARSELLVPHQVGEPYDPVLVAIDDESDPHAACGRVAAAVDELGLSTRLVLLRRDFRGSAQHIADQHGLIDLLWFDAGGAPECIDALREYWPFIRPGGLVAVHGSYWTVPVTVECDGSTYRAVRSVPGAVANEVKRQLAAGGLGATFEALNLLEPHKWRQNSVLLLRRLAPLEATRDSDLAQELPALGVASPPAAEGFDLQSDGPVATPAPEPEACGTGGAPAGR